MKKKFLCLVLALAMLLSLVACGGNNNTPTNDNQDPAPTTDDNNTPSDTPDDAEPAGWQPFTYDDEEVYMTALGDFYNAMLTAKESTELDELYALMAVAEAKLMESATLLPLNSDGGNYAISRVVPRTAPSVYWGSDIDRYETCLVATEFITAEHRDELTAMWGELAGTGTYEAEARKFLEEHGYTLQDTYGYSYGTDPDTWDTLTAWTNVVGEPVCNLVDGLVKYDMENIIQPCLAESWECSEDGLTWTFHLRDAVWTDSQGRKVDDVKADDWVAALQHMFDHYGDSAAEVLAAIVEGGLDYCDGVEPDFSKVGVEAVDDKTLVYHLVRPVAAFETMLTYCGMGAPLCRSYYVSQGGTFGADHDNGTYGSSPDNIAYCGPYLVSNWTPQNTIVFDANPMYWNAGNLNINKITWYYSDGTDPLKPYNDTISGLLPGTGLGTSALIKCQEDGYFDEYAYRSSLTGTTRIGFTNLNRQSFALFTDPTAGVSPQTHDSVDAIDRMGGIVTTDIIDDAARTHLAMNNQNFRLALAFALDRAGYRAQQIGDELKEVSLRNSYTPANFAVIENDVTIDINGTPTTFPGGTYYGAIMQAQIDADGIPIKVWDPDAEAGLGSGDGFDGWYNVDNARKYLKTAMEELAERGLEITTEEPIQIDYYYGDFAESYINRAQAYKQSVEASLEGYVVVNLVACKDNAELNATNYSNTYGYEDCVDVALGTGWSADYGDPASYLDNCLPYGDGYQTKNLGVW